MLRLLCILLILMHIVEINIWIFVCIFYLLKDNFESRECVIGVSSASCWSWCTFLENLEECRTHAIPDICIWVLNFFSRGSDFYERYQQIISTCGADVKHQVWQVPNVLFLCYCYVQVLPTNKKCQINADQWHRWWHSHILQWNDWRVYFNETLSHYSPM